MSHANYPQHSQEPFAKSQVTPSIHRSRPMFVNMKSRLHLPGVADLLAPCTQHLTANQYKRMVSAWQSMEIYQVFGFVQYGRVIGILTMEEKTPGIARVLTVAVNPNYQRRGLGRRLVVEAFCSLGLFELTAMSLGDNLGFYTTLGFQIRKQELTAIGQVMYTCVLSKQALYANYKHEYSAGAVLYCEQKGERLYVLVTEQSGNTGLPKGHVEEGETETQTALREIYEETGITAKIIPGFGGEIVYPQGRGMLKHFTYFLATFDCAQGIASGDDVQAHILPYNQAYRKLSFSDVRVILKEAEQFLNQNDSR
ncbi:MAG: GNAT family N-acetyltransferase [Clostridiales bacterium]|nr:GNAT family N-acetyltransferase [Clostridiales bacterium]